jgi:uncharacterized protein
VTTGANRASGMSKHVHGSVLSVIVVPRAAKSSLEQLADGAIQVRVSAPPVDGAANAALLRLLANALDVPLSRLEIIGGPSSRRKRITVRGLKPDKLETPLRAALGNAG